ncbi:hypothetical protein HPB49_022236 [Dermacentor silvarum]|uniref:Uncharacterized protein n=1 Tax=Dermacentor silvarum TaxID=543639 RepID=A0ACB8DGG5_DERSI|nr:hypothetical protein HPB49_022236 [Dermacentor silvarum]
MIQAVRSGLALSLATFHEFLFTGDPDTVVLYIVDDEDVVATVPDFQREEDFSWFALLSCFRKDFLLMLLKRRCPDDEDKSCFIAEVLMIGPSIETVNFVYRLEFVGQRSRLRMESRPVSVHRIADISVTGGGGFQFVADIVQHFRDGKDLILNVIISECNNATDWEHLCRPADGDVAEDIWGSLSG